jgi:hypothetical protein
MHLHTMYCHEISTSANAVTSQSSLEAQLAKNASHSKELSYIYQSFSFKRLLVAIAGIDFCSFSSLPAQSKLPTATKTSKCSKQKARKK